VWWSDEFQATSSTSFLAPGTKGASDEFCQVGDFLRFVFSGASGSNPKLTTSRSTTVETRLTNCETLFY
jgi:hypothetical protein